MPSRLIVAILGAAAILAIASPASAQPIQATGRDESQAVGDRELDGLRGGDGTQTIITSQMLNAVTSGNVINGGSVAGNVSISDSALSNFNGIGNIIINTGAQVSLQTGMNVTINMGP